MDRRKLSSRQTLLSRFYVKLAYQDPLVPYIYAGDLSPRRWGFSEVKRQESVDGNVSRDEFDRTLNAGIHVLILCHGPKETLPLLVIPADITIETFSQIGVSGPSSSFYIHADRVPAARDFSDQSESVLDP